MITTFSTSDLSLAGQLKKIRTNIVVGGRVDHVGAHCSAKFAMQYKKHRETQNVVIHDWCSSIAAVVDHMFYCTMIMT